MLMRVGKKYIDRVGIVAIILSILLSVVVLPILLDIYFSPA